MAAVDPPGRAAPFGAMSTAQVAVDVSRLVTGLRFSSPTGVERWELGYAERLTPGPGIILSPIGARALGQGVRSKVVTAARRAWGENNPGSVAAELQPIAEFLHAGRRARPQAPPLKKAGWRTGGLLPSFARAALSLPTLTLPRDAAYLHASFFRLETPGYFDWLRRRPDIKAFFALHDLLPLTHPAYFRAGEAELHRSRIETAARRGRGLIVGCHTVGEALRAHLRQAGLPEPPIHMIHGPVEPEFTAVPARQAGLDAAPYFVICGTIEPRKNHALLLDVWEKLAARRGADTPRLILVGRRGWRNEGVFERLDRLEASGALVLEAQNISTPALAALIAQARGLLSPSFAEGFGIPVAEALALGTPVVAADTDVYRELWSGQETLLPPSDVDGWLGAIEALAAAPRRDPRRALQTWEGHAAAVREMIAAA